MAAESRFCSKCRKTMAATNFYTYKNGDKCELCKPCLTMHVNNFKPDTFLWLLEKFDVPYVPMEWNILRDREYQKCQLEKKPMNGMTVFGKYISKFKLKQWINKETGELYGWADSEYLQNKADEDAKKYGVNEEDLIAQYEEMKQAHIRGEITDAQWMTYKEIYEPTKEPTDIMEPEPIIPAAAEQFGGNGGGPQTFVTIDLPDVGAELTEEDKLYLATKWGVYYTPQEWVSLEQLYEEFMNSFDIQGAARLDTLKMICKTSLKMNQAIDSGDIDTYQKLSKVYDSMMKSAKFTEAQRKEEKSGDFDAVGQVVFFAEKYKGKIERFNTKEYYDMIDEKMDNLKRYEKDLIMNDTALAQMIENYIKRREAAEEQKKDAQKAKEEGFDVVQIKDEDYSQFNEFIENELKEEGENES